MILVAVEGYGAIVGLVVFRIEWRDNEAILGVGDVDVSCAVAIEHGKGANFLSFFD